MIKKVIDGIIKKVEAVDRDKSPLKLQGLKMLFEFKLPFMLHTKIEAEFKIKKREVRK